MLSGVVGQRRRRKESSECPAGSHQERPKESRGHPDLDTMADQCREDCGTSL